MKPICCGKFMWEEKLGCMVASLWHCDVCGKIQDCANNITVESVSPGGKEKEK